MAVAPVMNLFAKKIKLEKSWPTIFLYVHCISKIPASKFEIFSKLQRTLETMGNISLHFVIHEGIVIVEKIYKTGIM